MKELTSKRNKENVQRVSNETYELMVKKGMHKKFTVRDIPSRPLKDVPVAISAPTKLPEKQKKLKSKKENG